MLEDGTDPDRRSFGLLLLVCLSPPGRCSSSLRTGATALGLGGAPASSIVGRPTRRGQCPCALGCTLRAWAFSTRLSCCPQQIDRPACAAGCTSGTCASCASCVVFPASSDRRRLLSGGSSPRVPQSGSRAESASRKVVKRGYQSVGNRLYCLQSFKSGTERPTR